MSRHTNRREFLQTTAAAGVGFWVAGRRHSRESKSPNERSASPASASAAREQRLERRRPKHGDIVAICDVDDDTLDEGRAAISQGARSLTTSARCSTRWARASTPSPSARPTTRMPPPRCHGHEDGQACFCQKPLTHSI